MDLTVHSFAHRVDRMVHSTPARLAGKTALVTGATSNIGRAIAIAFAAEGAHVAVAGRDRDRGAAVVKEIEAAGGRAMRPIWVSGTDLGLNIWLDLLLCGALGEIRTHTRRVLKSSHELRNLP